MNYCHEMLELVASVAPAANPRRGALIECDVLEVSSSGAVVSFGGKSDAIVPAREIGNGLKVGERAQFVVLGSHDETDSVTVSRRLAQLWQELDWANYLGETVTVHVTRVVRKHGSLMGVQVKYKKKGVSGFIPASLLGALANGTDELKEDDCLRVKVREVQAPERLILDRRQVVQDERVAELKEGDVLSGNVRSIGVTQDGHEFGVFVDVGGVAGLVHRSEAPQSGQLLSAQYKPGQRVQVEVLGTSERGGRKVVSLSIKKPLQSAFLRSLQEGMVLEGTVSKEATYGLFVSLSADSDLRGLVHRSALPWAVRSGKRQLKPGEKVNVRVESVKLDKGQVSLSMRDLPQSPETV